MHQPALRRLQRVNDHRLYSNLCGQFHRVLPQDQARFAARGLAPGIALVAVLPEVVAGETKAHIELDGVKYRCRWRVSSVGGGHVLLLEEENE